jgi:hypothetical protein
MLPEAVPDGSETARGRRGSIRWLVPGGVHLATWLARKSKSD